ncbi:MAG: hypothetical protein QGI05_05185 [Candidatus Omnitrophota bacterium]|nr:hypothetical protein [Candidatus Omnitrophota bacterium]
MILFKKALSIRLISIVLAGIFLINTSAYAATALPGKFSLRAPILTNSNRDRLKEGARKFTLLGRSIASGIVKAIKKFRSLGHSRVKERKFTLSGHRVVIREIEDPVIPEVRLFGIFIDNADPIYLNLAFVRRDYRNGLATLGDGNGDYTLVKLREPNRDGTFREVPGFIHDIYDIDVNFTNYSVIVLLNTDQTNSEVSVSFAHIGLEVVNPDRVNHMNPGRIRSMLRALARVIRQGL